MISTYPKEMRHPNYRPAVISGYRRNTDGSVANDPPGSPSMNPPVWVNNYDQELYYASLGYLPVGVTDSKAYFETVGDAAKPKTYSHVEYPKWVHHCHLRQDVVDSRVVNNPDELERLGDGWFDTAAEAVRAAAQVVSEPDASTEDVAQTVVEDVVQVIAEPRAKRKYTRHSQAT